MTGKLQAHFTDGTLECAQGITASASTLDAEPTAVWLTLKAQAGDLRFMCEGKLPPDEAMKLMLDLRRCLNIIEFDSSDD